MTEIRQLLFPIDFAPEYTAPADYVRERARQFGANLTVLHVADPKTFRYHGGDLGLRPLSEIQDDLIAVQEKKFNDLVDRLFGQADVRRVMKVGGEAETIASFAKEGGFEVIMLPMKHRNILSAALEDSLVAKVMELAETALWTLEDSGHLSASLHRPSTLCAFDFHSDGSLDGQNRRIVETARLISRTLHTKITLMHVIAPDDMSGRGRLSGIRLKAWLEEQLLLIRNEVGLEAEYLLGHGDVPNTIAETAAKLGAGLVITGRSHRYTFSGQAQAAVTQLVRHSPCPVLSLR
jgi:nucleotide-binding universal stress UspA family protein